MVSSMPASATKSRQCASRLSPIEKRGKRCLSSTSTSCPARFSSAAAIAPEGPAPITTTWRRSHGTSAPARRRLGGAGRVAPKRVEVEPLQRLEAQIVLEALRKALRALGEDRIPLRAAPLDALGERLEI